MVNAETNCIIDFIDSRDMKAVSKWLQQYPNIEIVIRDWLTGLYIIQRKKPEKLLMTN